MKKLSLLAFSLVLSSNIFAGGFESPQNEQQSYEEKKIASLRADIGKRFYIYPGRFDCPEIKDVPQTTVGNRYKSDEPFGFSVTNLVWGKNAWGGPSLSMFYRLEIDGGGVGFVDVMHPFSNDAKSDPLDTSHCMSTISPTEMAEAQAVEKKKQLDQEKESQKAQKIARAKAAAQRAKPGVEIGMTAKQVKEDTSWGAPEHINRTTTGGSVEEQWVYGGGNYLYFTNGRLTAVQN